MALGRGIQLKERIGLAIDFDGFFGLHGARNNERLIYRDVKERDFAVFGMNIRFHFSIVS